MKRIVYLDLLRVFAIFGVIVIHVFCDDYPFSFPSGNWFVALVGDSLVRWSVPIFVMISGALFLNPEKEISIKEILLKKILRLLTIYVFWTLAYGVVVTGFKMLHQGEAFTLELLLSPHFHLWFLPMLMGVYLLIPFLRIIAKDEKLLQYALILWAVYVTIGFFSPKGEIIRQFSILFNINILFGYAGYFLLGYYLSKKIFSKNQRKTVYLLGIIGLLTTVLGNYFMTILKGYPYQQFWDYLSPNVVVTSMALFVFVKEMKVGDRAIKFTEYVRNDIFGTYLTHALWLLLLNISAIRNCTYHIITLPIITIAVFVCSLFTTKLLRKIPFLKKTVE